MTELEALDRDISALTELLRIAWKHLADPSLTAFERREMRNQIRHSSAELRSCLQTLEAERSGSRKLSMEEHADRPSFEKPKLRFLRGGL
jgi:hypothetical protein